MNLILVLDHKNSEKIFNNRNSAQKFQIEKKLKFSSTFTAKDLNKLKNLHDY